MEPGRMAKGAKKGKEKTVSILEVQSFAEAEALAQLGFEYVGMTEEGTAFEFREPSR